MNKRIKLDGMSSENSAAFFSSDNSKVAIATMEEGGALSVKILEEQPQRKNEKKSINGLTLLFLVSVVFREVSFHLNLPFFLYHIPTIFWIWLYIRMARKKFKNKEILKYHGAEHKVINWFNKRNKKFGFKEVKKASRICMYCGTNRSATIATFQIVSSICMLIYNIHIPEVITIVLPMFLFKVFPFNFLGLLTQLFFTTAEPEAKHLYVAKEALKAICNESM